MRFHAGEPHRNKPGPDQVAANTSLTSGLTGRYANALFELARDGAQLDEVAGDLDGLGTLIDENEDFARLIRSPVLGRDEQGKAMAAILDRAGAIELVRKFVGLLAHNRRLFVLPQIVRAYRALLADYRGEVGAEVTSARPLSEAQQEALGRALAQAVGREVNLTARVDDGLIGGLIVRLGSRMLDTSLRTQLQNLKLAMKGVG